MTDADKRDRIIAAAYDVLSKKGFDKASTKEIANTAGVAQGLINYYFPSKDLLFAEVFRRETKKYCATFGPLALDGKPLSITSIAGMLEEPKSRALQEPEWFRLRYELSAIGLRNDNAKEILKEMLTTKKQHISAVIQSIEKVSPEQADTLASILYAVIDGLGLQKVADPEFKYDEAYGMLAGMLGAYYQMISKKEEA
ncbi:TetR/AcrR family transcriptional regulator [Cohnella abietis]|uniref:TetR family transcriptional regulator n=1 Tax=Cohnella abietis TaxID=2507935 RepID=A0A3T1CZY9_9BACL|nr:TetR/AcrR family transcriptional regulator [Cohnella abietis]BBI31413.1 TetR family transcriptional regulator [Cohnella abietis]